ncbi:MAG: exodeoxyribonuclease VII large subunit [Caldimonas sp.]
MIGAANGGPRRAWSVTEIIGAVAASLEREFFACTVAGEISGFSRAASGHCYFNLKDASSGAALRCAMFRRASSLLAFAPRDGQAVEVRGRLSVYEQRGELQFVVEAMQQGGAGALYERFVKLRERLEAEGWFAAARKRALPPFPSVVGVVTSLGGAVLHDVATTLARRSPHVRVVVYPSAVQGTDAPLALCEAISDAGRRAEVDLLIVCRGGGSLEDLWAFNDERVVRAICAAPMPVVSGVGHETDVTLADLAADLRAATPTAAAELAAPATLQQRSTLDAAERSMSHRALAWLDAHSQRLDHVGLRLARPGDGVLRMGHALGHLSRRLGAALLRTTAARRAATAVLAQRLNHAMAIGRAGQRARLAAASSQLLSLSPERVLARGYALLRDSRGQAITSVAQIAAGDAIRARLGDGSASLSVTAIDGLAG